MPGYEEDDDMKQENGPTIEQQPIPQGVTHLKVTDRGIDEYMRYLGFTQEQQLRNFFIGKRFTSLGSGLKATLEIFAHNSGAKEVHIIDPSLGLNPAEWTIRKGSINNSGNTFYRRGTELPVALELERDAMQRYQDERLALLSRENMSIHAHFIPPFPNVAEQDILFDFWGPMAYLKSKDERRDYLYSAVNSLAHGGRFYLITDPDLDIEIQTSIVGDLRKQGIKVQFITQPRHYIFTKP